eukprot:TRINITY_DN2367_c0_g1_i1.p1 TRINITY_DN2367_c0_g1~~TRINITY_DN2367_c0_g1_i1.p1  ORF type:complete len:654 (+),score=135.13 TRINITY_DN2367_c0_g1_i1:43-2004(+)
MLQRLLVSRGSSVSLCKSPLQRSLLSSVVTPHGRLFSSTSTVSFTDETSPYRTLIEAHPKPPRLYLPTLEQTCENYLNNVLPMLQTPQQIEHTKSVVQQFKTKEGVELHKALQEYDKTQLKRSYVAEFWDDMYLEGPWPLPVNVNPFFQFLDKPFSNPTTGDIVARTTKITSGFLKFCVEMRAGRLPTEWKVPNKHPFDMSQFYRLFGTSRIARPGRDISATYTPQESRHLVVLHNKNFYSFDVLNEKGEQMSDAKLASTFARILSDSSAAGEGVGVLTTLDRDEWGAVRLNLESNSINKESLDKIDSALFLVCFDDASPTTPEDISTLLLHGYPGTRWYDKSFSVVTFKNGIAGCNFEHSWGDGATWVSFVNKALQYMASVEVPANAAQQEPSPFQKLNWVLRPYVKSEILKANEFSTELLNSVDTKVFSFEKWGREEIKKLGLSPDAFVQMAFQVAYYTLHNKVPPTYESASTRHFLRGRTETIRTVSSESANLVKLVANTNFMQSPTTANGRLIKEALRKACARHVTKTADAMEGRGSDRHLFALLNLAKKLHKTSNDSQTPFVPPKIYSDPAYSLYHHILVSTSNLSTPTLALFGFGATSGDGYGFGYNILADKVVANITSFKNQGTSSSDFDSTLRRAMDLLRYAVLV